ncbi:MAG: DEAD/DEAH box helicase [Ruthenibacterium lactatiformans]
MNYSELNVPEQIHKAVERMGFTEMTEVQEKAIPPMMEGKDIIAKAPTGTGKTCAFGIPLILGLDQSGITAGRRHSAHAGRRSSHRRPAGWRIFIRTSASSPYGGANI